MSDILDINFGKKPAVRPACHVAYTLNNTQPVACTIIGDQPLFYMDYNIDYEDEDIGAFDAADLRILEKELTSLKKEMESFDRLSSEFAQTPGERFQEFLDDQEVITKDAPRAPADLDALISTVRESRIGAAYIDFATEHKVEIKFSGQVAEGEYDRKSGQITINRHLDFADQILICARELRRHWQHRQGALINPLLFHPDNAVLINRVQVADLAVSMVRLAWELQLSGIKQPWERIENSSLSDLGHSLAREAFLDFRTLNNGEASAAVFESWFLSERCLQEDKTLIQKMLADYGGYVFDLQEAEESITPALIAALGTMPYGKNYLAQHATTLMNDPIFTDVRDRSNANFLWFIKFERSFRETEQELQIDPAPTKEGVRSSLAQQQNQDLNHDTQKSAGNIVSLFTDVEDGLENGQASDSTKTGDKRGKSGNILSPKRASKRNKNKRSADIIYLRRWSGE